MSIKLVTRGLGGYDSLRETFGDKSEEAAYDSWLLRMFLENKISPESMKLSKQMIRIFFDSKKTMDICIKNATVSGGKETIFEITTQLEVTKE